MYIHRERRREREKGKESGTFRRQRNFENSKFNETKSVGRVFLVKYFYICIRFWMYEILLRQLKLVSTICICCHQNKTFKQI